MRLRLRLLLPLMLVPVSSCSTVGSSAAGRIQAAAGTQNREYQIYSTVVDSLYGSRPVSAHVVADSTLTDRNFSFGTLPHWTVEDMNRMGLSADLVSDYEQKLGSAIPLEGRRFSTRWPTVVVDKEVREGIVNETNSSVSGFLLFSRPGFSLDGEQAVVHVVRVCGGRCGLGQIVVLKRQNGRWVIQQTQTTVRI